MTAMRLQHLAAKLHSLGPRPTYELLRELIAGADLVERLERYAKLDPGLVHAIGADVLPVNSLTVIDGDRR